MKSSNASKSSDNARKLLEKAVSLHLAGKFDEAQTCYLKLIKRKQFAAKSLNLLGTLMFQAGKAEKSRYYFDKSLRADATAVDTYVNYSATLEMLGDVPGAMSVCRKGLKAIPTSQQLKSKMLGYLVATGRYDEAVAYGEKLLPSASSDLSVLSSLNAACFFAGDTRRALELGERFLTLRDQQVTSQSASVCTGIARGDAATLAMDATDQVIAFSLWGSNRFYTDGALRNVELADRIYPDWRCRFYCGTSVPPEVSTGLRELGAEVVTMPEEQGFGGAFWRFLVADDPRVERFMIRDADSRLNERERSAVDEWMDSRKPFHLIRDAVVHCDLILAGLWGGCRGHLPPMHALLERYPDRSPKFADQNFLATFVWPLVKDRVLIHDSHYQCFGSRPFPENTDLGGSRHVGAGVVESADPPRTVPGKRS